MQGDPTDMNPRPASTRLRRALPLVVALAIGAAAGAGAYALSSHGSKTPSAAPLVVPAQPASSTSSVDSLTQLYNEDAPGVVDITVESTTSGGSSGGFPFGNPGGSQKQRAEGTGFEIDSKGNILTAEHVVDKATSIKVTFQDGSTAKATRVGKPDKSTDTAVIHVDIPASQLHPLALGNSSTVQPGQSVVAIGSPFGLAETMTHGIVSAVNRTIQAPNNYSITGAIQTDAAINHGNSGGPLLDLDGKVVGVNAQIESESGGNDGVGFAIPSSTVASIVGQIVDGGAVEHAYLGVSVTETTGGTAGAQLAQVRSGTPAANAGLRAGDVVTAVDGDTVASAAALQSAIDAKKPGDRVIVDYLRNGQRRTVTVTLATRPS